jgi:uncharacterized BrkB/YihY/UPF0761 family membrane protein
VNRVDTPPGGAAPAPDPSAPETEAAGRVARATRWARSEQARVTGAVDQGRQRLESVRPRSLWVDVGFRAYEHDTSAGGAVLAGAVAFRMFLFIVPYVFVLVVGIGLAADAAEEDAGSLARSAGIGGLVAKAVSGAADLSGFERVTAVVVGAIALFLGARALLKVLRLSYGMVWNVKPSKLKKTTLPVLAVVGFTTIGVIIAATVGELRHEGVFPAILGFALTTSVPIAMWLAASWYLPRRARTWQELVPGAVMFGVGVQVLHIVTVLWIAHVLESKTDTYGAIGAALAILLWAYLLGRLVTGAAVLDAALWLRRRDDRRGASGAGMAAPSDAVRDDAGRAGEGNP